MFMPDGSDKTLRVEGIFDVLHELNEVLGPHKRRTSWSFVFKPLLSNHSRDHRERCAYSFFLNLSAHNEIIVVISASSMVFLERLRKRLSERMSSVAACFAAVFFVKRTLSCKTEDKTLRVDQPLHTEKKGQLLNTLERYHIYNLSKQKIHMNDTFADKYNPIFE
jgi:hypothetical protein